MPLRVVYANPDDDIIDITDRIEVETFEVSTHAEEGSVSISTLVVDDPLGDIFIAPHRVIKCYEDDADTGEQTIGVFNVGTRKIKRGPYRTGPARTWEVELYDVNNHLDRRIMVGSDTIRPAETDLERVAWLLSTAEMSRIEDDLYVATTGPVAMDKATYTGQNGVSIFDDAATLSGRNYFVWWNEAETKYSLWYRNAADEVFDSPLKISNVISDVLADENTFYPDIEGEMTLDPARVVDGVYLPYGDAAKYVYVRRDATFEEIGIQRDMAASSFNIKTAAKATAKATRILNDVKDEDLTVECTIIVPKEKVNQILAGMRIEARFTHLPGLEGFTWMRSLSRTVTWHDFYSYRVKLKLTAAVADPVAGIVSHMTDSHVGNSLATWPSGDPTPDDFAVAVIAIRDGTLSNTDVFPHSQDEAYPGGIEVPGTDWAYVTEAKCRTSSYPLVLASKVLDSDDTTWLAWDGVGGDDRPRGLHVAIRGAAGTLDTPVIANTQSTSGSVFTSPDITVGGPGFVLAGFSYSAAGPGDGSSAPFSMTPESPAVTLDSGYAIGSFAPYSWFGYIRVEAAGTFNFVLNRSAVPRGNTNGYCWIVTFAPDA